MQHVQISMLSKRSIDMDNLLFMNKDRPRLPAEDRAAFFKAGTEYLVLFNALGQHNVNEGLRLFNVTIKAHYLFHCVLRSEFFNPRFGWCYGGEDYMKLSKRLMAACVQGNSKNSATKKSAIHYRVGLHLALSRAE